MVVRMEKAAAASSKSRKYVGNGLNISIQENAAAVTVIGNECKIRIGANDGALKVVGNSCDVRVSAGSGHIHYNGNEGRIRLGAHVDEASVKYVGNEGKIYREEQRGDKNSRTYKLTKVAGGVPDKKRSSEKSNHTIDINGVSHKQFSLRNSVLTLAVPSVIVLPCVTSELLKKTKSKNKQ